MVSYDSTYGDELAHPSLGRTLDLKALSQAKIRMHVCFTVHRPPCHVDGGRPSTKHARITVEILLHPKIPFGGERAAHATSRERLAPLLPPLLHSGAFACVASEHAHQPGENQALEPYM